MACEDHLLNNISFNYIVSTVQNLHNDPMKLSETEEINLYIYLTEKDTKLAVVERFLKFCRTDRVKLFYLRELSKCVSGAFL